MHAPAAPEDNRLLRSIPAARVALIERIARAGGVARGRDDLKQRFLRAYFHGVAEEDLAERPPGQLAKAAMAAEIPGFRIAPEGAWVGDDEFLPKPLDMKNLLEKIRRRIENAA